MLVAFAPVDGSEWIVVIQEPIEDLIGPLLRFPSLVLAVAASAGILSLLILFVGWWTIIRPLQQLAAYRIVQEALNNALQHAHAKQITIRVQCEMPMLVLTVVDDGFGFEFPDQPYLLTHEGHFGLLGMQERAMRLGGTFHVHTAPGQGTCVTVRLPNQSIDDG